MSNNGVKKMVLLNASPDLVQATIFDFDNYKYWIPEVTASLASTKTELAKGRDKILDLKVNYSFFNDEYSLVYNWFPADRKFKTKLLEPSKVQKSHESVVSLNLVDSDKTLLTCELDIVFKVPLITPLRKKIQDKILSALLDRLDSRLKVIEER